MIPEHFDGLVWLLLLLGPLLFFQQRLHRELQGVFLILSRSPAATIILFSLIFFPGVVLHEGSHYLMALILRVRTGKFSLLPRALPGGKLQLGYVETAVTDPLRDTLIGAAPLLAGCGFILLSLLWQPVMGSLAEKWSTGEWTLLWQAIKLLPDQPDFWLWFYLAFTVSSMMFPSASDRRSWFIVAGIITLLVGFALAVGGGGWILANLAPRLNILLRSFGAVFGISLGMHLALFFPTWMIRAVLSKATGLQLAG